MPEWVDPQQHSCKGTITSIVTGHGIHSILNDDWPCQKHAVYFIHWVCLTEEIMTRLMLQLY